MIYIAPKTLVHNCYIHTYIHTYIQVQEDFVAVQFILSTFLVSRSLDRSKITHLFFEKRGKKEASQVGRRQLLILAVDENGCENALSSSGQAHGCAIQTIFEYGSGKGTIVNTTHSVLVPHRMKGAFDRIFGVCRPEFCLWS
jgi:hypothetical protein